MTKVTQNSFLGGQLDFELMGRQDIEKYRKGASRLVNFNLIKRGAISKRQGFDRLVDLDALGIDATARVRLVPFAFKKEHGFILVFSYRTVTGEGGATHREGTCHAVCVVEGSVSRWWEVPPPQYSSGVEDGFTTDDDVASFDYQQCGYRLYIAHQGHHPSVIEGSEADIDAALSAETPPQSSPLVWKHFEAWGIENGVPQIDSFIQTRSAPTADMAGGKVTAKYRVSAVFDDKETAACPERYNTGCIEPYTGVLQTTTTPSYTTKTAGTSNNGVTSIPEVRTTVKASSRKGTTNGTQYYAPWDETQVITLNIVVRSRDRQQGGIIVHDWPDQIRVYKKEKGYYGLIGTVVPKSGAEAVYVDGDADSGSALGSNHMLKTSSYVQEKVGSDWQDPEDMREIASARALFDDGEGAWAVDPTSPLCNISDGEVLTITPDQELGVGRNAFIELSLGKVYREFAPLYHIPSGGTDPEIDTDKWQMITNSSTKRTYKPKWQNMVFVNNKSNMVTVTANVSYRTSSAGQWQTASGSRRFDITAHGSDTEQTYSESGYSVFLSKCDNKFSEFVENTISDASAMNARISVDSVLETMTELEDAVDVRINSILIAPYAAAGTTAGTLVISGVSMFSQGSGSTMVATFEDNNIIADTSITPFEEDAETIFKNANDYPACVALSQQRLIWASSKRNPERIWMSAIGDFTTYTAHEVQTDSDTIQFDLPVTRFAKLNHIVEMKSLIAFNSACEWLINSASTVSGITYETIQARPQSYIGSNERLKPLICNNSVLFCERTGQAVRQFAYQIQDDGFAGRDVSVLSSSIFETNNIRDWTYQQFPNGVVWCVLSDGTMASFTFMPEQDTAAWGTHRHAADGTRFEAISTSYAVSPSLEEVRSRDSLAYDLATHQEVFALTRDAAGRRWIERMRIRSKAEDSVYNSLTMDSMRVVMDAAEYNKDSHPDGMMPASSGARYFSEVDGKEMSRADAAAYVGQNAGRDPDDPPYRVYEGFPVEAMFMSVYPVLGTTVGVGQFDVKDIVNVGLRLQASAGGEVCSAHWLDKDPQKEKREAIRYSDDLDHPKDVVVEDGVVHLHNDDCANVKPLGINCRDGRIVVTQGIQWPFTLLALETDLAVETEGQNG